MTGQPREPRRFLITVDDAGGLIRDLEVFGRVTSFLREEAAPATFFVVPRGPDGWRLDQEPEWTAALQEAESEGHDCQLHGLDHGSYEFGPYPRAVLELGGPGAVEAFEAKRGELSREWRTDLFVEKLNRALDIFGHALGRKPLAFRGGAASHSPESFAALNEVGVHYDSNKILDPRGWKYIIGEYERPGDWDPEVQPGPYRVAEGVVELPIVSEYAWQLTPEKIERHLALALEDLERVYALGSVFLFVCHTQCVGTPEDYARTLLSRFFRVAREEYQVQFQTVRELAADLERGAVPLFTP
jgi:peptidoglycan/xylan/chitin deacetylase (PgdA/CDA1 family)